MEKATRLSRQSDCKFLVSAHFQVGHRLLRLLFVPIHIGKRLHHGLQQGRLIVFHTEQIVFAEVLQHLEQRSIGERGIAREQLNKGILFEKLVGMLLQTISFVRLIPFGRILGEDDVKVMHKQVERMGHALFGTWIGNGSESGDESRKGRSGSGQGKPP